MRDRFVFLPGLLVWLCWFGFRWFRAFDESHGGGD